MMLLLILVLRSLPMRVWRFTVSKALLMSRVTAIVRLGGCFWLNPEVMILLMEWRAVVVECLCLIPCWDAMFGILSVM